MNTEWEEFKRILNNFDPDAEPMSEEQLKRFQELIWTAKPPTQRRERDTRTLEEVIDDLNDYRKKRIAETNSSEE